MDCPRCRVSPLIEKKKNRVTIDYCPDCRGIWLDRGELETLIAQANQDYEHDYTHHDEEHDYRNYEDRDRDLYRREKSYRDSDSKDYKKRKCKKKGGWLETLTDLLGD